MTTLVKPDWRMHDVEVRIPAGADGSPAWHAERHYGVGGTDASTLMGVNLYQAHGLLQQKISKDPTPGPDDDILAFGHALEPRIAAHLEQGAAVRTRRVGLVRSTQDGRRWQYANPDRLTADGGLAEFKTAGWSSRAGQTWRDGRIPDHAYVQGQHYLDVTGRTHMWYAVAIRDDRIPWQEIPRRWWGTPWFAALAVDEWIIAGPIERDEDLLTDMRVTGQRFMGCVDRGELDELFTAMLPIEKRYPVPIQGSTVEPLIADLAQQDIDRYRAILAEERALSTEKAAIADRVKSMIGEAEALTIGGTEVATWKGTNRTSFDRKAFADDYPELAEQYTKTTTGRTLNVKKEPKSEHDASDR